MKLPWHRHEQTPVATPPDGHPEIAPHELRQLSTVFKSPPWLENLGHAAWLLVGLILLLIGLAWFLGATYRDILAFLILFVILVVRPSGLLGARAM